MLIASPRFARADTIVVDDAFASRAIGRDMDLFVDDSATLTAEQLATPEYAKRFVPSTRLVPNFGFTKAAVWARFKVRDARARSGPVVLEIAYAPIDRVEIHGPGGTEVVGDLLPFHARAVEHRYPNVFLSPSPNEATYLVRFSGQSSLQLALVLYSERAHTTYVARDQTIQGAYIGLLAAMLIYNLVLFVGARSRTYLYYALFIGAFLGYQTSIEGLTYQLIWPQNPWLANHAVPFFACCTGTFGARFAQRFVGTAQRLPRLHRVTSAFAAVATVVAAASLFLPVSVGLKVVSILAVVFGVLLLGIAAAGVRDGSRPARLFLAAWTIFLAGCALAGMRVGGHIATTPLTVHAVQVGSGLEVLLLSIGLADRIRLLRERAAKSQDLVVAEKTRAAGELERLNQELRRQIGERSHALAVALAGLDARRHAEVLSVGDLFDKRYRVVRALGQGGMGAVFEVVRVRDEHRFALKVMTGRATASDSARFAREAEVAARVHHRHLVSIADVGVAANGTLYIVMELVDGSSLEELRPCFGDPGWAVSRLAQIAAGLSALHSARIVHRDLKPGNVLVAPGDVMKIADFGIARFDESGSISKISVDAKTLVDARVSGVRGRSAGLTDTGALLGTPMYMAPELVLGMGDTRASADVFAFGVMAYEMIAGRPPFATPVIFDILGGHGVPAITPLSGVASELSATIVSCLSADVARRPNAQHVMEVLTREIGFQAAAGAD